MVTNKTRVYCADFETTVYDGQQFTEVWAAAIVELNTEDVIVFNSIDKLFGYILTFDYNSIIYFHNIKFDGEFWLSYLLTKTNFKPAFIQTDPEKADGFFEERKNMKDRTFTYLISSPCIVGVASGIRFSSLFILAFLCFCSNNSLQDSNIIKCI
mgnify:CR=1 FL=1